MTAEHNMLSKFEGKKVMFFFPHEDDEVNTAGSLLIQFSKINVNTRIVYSTCGELFVNSQRRIREAKKALSLVGISEDHIVFLGFPDVSEIEAIFYDKEKQLDEIIACIDDFKPDYIITNDKDKHPNHIELSILVDEALRKITNKKGDYFPIELKTYAYDLAYFSEEDYSAYNLKSTIKPQAINNKEFSWESRLRLPVPIQARKKILEKNIVYSMLWRHHSQSAFLSAGRVANADKVYWVKRFDHPSFQAKCLVSSGNAGWINDSVCDNYSLVFPETTDNIWHPEDADKDKTIKMVFPNKVDINEIIIYENVTKGEDILEAELRFSDNSVVSVNSINHTGDPTRIYEGKKKNIEWIEFKIKQYQGDKYGINELVVKGDKSEKIWFIKICVDDEYIYTYYTEEDVISLNVLAYNVAGEVLNVHNKIRCVVDGEIKNISKIELKKKKTRIKVEYQDDHTIGDEVLIVRKKGYKKKEKLYKILGKMYRVVYNILDWCINEIYIVKNW